MSNESPEQPDFLTVEEAARVLRIGRTAAYALARLWRETDGREGLPVVAFGRALRVPRAALERISGGAITPASAAQPAKSPSAPAAAPSPTPSPMPSEASRRRRGRHSRKRPASPDQTSFPF